MTYVLVTDIYLVMHYVIDTDMFFSFTFFTLMVMVSSFDLIILVLMAIISRQMFLNDEVDTGYSGRPCSHRISFVTW